MRWGGKRGRGQRRLRCRLHRDRDAMDTTTFQNQLAILGADARALGERLAELDAKLGAFLTAVHAGQSALLTLARRVAPNAVRPKGGSALTVRSVGGTTPQPEPASVSDRSPGRPEPTGSTSGAAAARPAVDSAADEALLRELDTQTANIIRVRRRLSGGRRSVRELLEEYRAARER